MKPSEPTTAAATARLLVSEATSANPLVWLFTFARAFGAFIFLPVLTIFTSVTVIIYGSTGRDEEITYHMWLWSRAVLWYFGVLVIADGFENIPPSGGAILAFNHQSHFDIPAITGSSSRLVRYGAKIELFKIPFFGQAIRVAGCLPIARDNRREVFRIYQDAARQFEKGIVYALAPEGTRQRVPIIAKFKKGPFIFAANSGVPIVPVVVEGADRVLPKSQLLVNLGRMRRTIRVRVLQPIHPIAKPAVIGESVAPEIAIDLMERTRVAMVAGYAVLQAEAGTFPVVAGI